ncbi:MAG: hypothetical protein ACYC25_09380 [Paludibacter sp.]
MKTTNKITFWSFILPFFSSMFLFLFSILVSFYLFFIFLESNNYWAISIYFVFLLSLIIPSLILQFNYYRIDKNKVLIIDDIINEVRIIDKGTEFIFRLDEVDRVRMVNSKNYDDTYRILMPWHPYYYYMICLKNDDEFLVTRLVVRKLEKLLNVRIVYKREAFPFISKTALKRAKNG